MSENATIQAQVRAAHAAMVAGDYRSAADGYRALVPHAPVLAYHNLGVVLGRLGDWKAAERAFRNALEIDPNAPLPRKGLAILLMGQGRWTEGWPLFEACREFEHDRRPDLPFPRWQGEDLAGKRILIVREEGFGDQIQYARFLPMLRQMGARITLICSPVMIRLFEPLGIELLPTGTPQAIEADYWCGICSLGHMLGATLENLPNMAYLPCGSPIGGGGVGVVTRGRLDHFNDAHRSLSGVDEIRLMGLGRNLAPLATGARDFAETAEIVAGLDLVITVDTSVAHLAGAMGKRVWILLSAFDTDWRWMHDRLDSPWYPSARLYRQTTVDDWDPVLSAVEQDLKANGLP